MAGPPGDAVPEDPVALLLGGDAGLAMHDGVDLVAPPGEAARHLQDMDAASGAAGDGLVGGHVDDPHFARGRRRPKNGPVRTPPKSTTSSFSTHVRARAAAIASAPGGFTLARSEFALRPSVASGGRGFLRRACS